MKIEKPESIKYIQYKDYTNTSNICGICRTSSKEDSLINIIRNIEITYRVSNAPEDKLSPGDQNEQK